MALALFALALLVDAGSPGPTVAALVSRVLKNGFGDVSPVLAAIRLGEALWLTVTVAGLAMVAEHFATAFLVMKFVGAAWLLLLAWGLWHAPNGGLSTPVPTRQPPWRMVMAGLLVSLGNPKNAVVYLALLPTIVDIGHVGPLDWAKLVATMLVTLAAVDLCWSAAAVQARRLLMSRRAMRFANKITGSLMAGAAAVVATR
jgi:threonine/homoserine/homoserine lactone efflux protein